MAIFNTLQSYWHYLTSDPLNFVIWMVYYAVAVLLALILHEISHGYVAYICGDPTAKMLGRLSLNPAKHLDPIGTVCMLLFHFGWARPVPVNPRNFSNYRKDDFLVSIAGITTNMTLYLLSTALAVGLLRLTWNNNSIAYYGAKAFLDSNNANGFVNALIISGPSAFNTSAFNHMWVAWIQRFLLLFGTMNLSLAIFNLLPIPPLDGFHVLNDTLLRGRLSLNRQTFQITQVAVIVLCATGALTTILSYAFNFVNGAVLELMLKIAGLA